MSRNVTTTSPLTSATVRKTPHGDIESAAMNDTATQSNVDTLVEDMRQGWDQIRVLPTEVQILKGQLLEACRSENTIQSGEEPRRIRPPSTPLDPVRPPASDLRISAKGSVRQFETLSPEIGIRYGPAPRLQLMRNQLPF